VSVRQIIITIIIGWVRRTAPIRNLFVQFAKLKLTTADRFNVPNCTYNNRNNYLPYPSVVWRCWLGGRKGIRPVKNWVVGCWRGYLSGARCSWCHCISCFSKIQTDFTYLVPAHPGSPGQGAVKQVLSTLHGCAPLSKLRAELALAIFMQIIKQN